MSEYSHSFYLHLRHYFPVNNHFLNCESLCTICFNTSAINELLIIVLTSNNDD